MVDIHSHILPNIDDGAKNIEETIEMGRIAFEEGITQIVATPHYIGEGKDASKEEVLKRIEEVNKLYKKEGIDIKVLPGNEVYLTYDILDHIKNNRILTVNNTDCILIEFPMNSVPLYAEDILYEIRLQGYTPIIAHPERYNQVISDPSIVKDWIEQGNLIQINSLSVLGKMGSKAKETAKYLLKNNLVHFVATDSHSPGTRSPRIREALNQIEKWTDKEQTNQIISNNFAIVTGENIELIKRRPIRKKKPFLFNFSWENIIK